MIKEKSKAWVSFNAKLGLLFSKIPLLPNFYTWLTLPAAVLGFIAITKSHIGLGFFLFGIAGLLDIIDGALARTLDKTSNAGAFLDGSLDRYIDFLLIFSYFWLPLQTPWLPLGQWICLAIFFAIMPSFEVAYANHRGAVYDPEEKLIWRILNRGEMYPMMLLVPLVAIFSAKWAGYILVALVLLSAITSLQTFFATIYLSETNKLKEQQPDQAMATTNNVEVNLENKMASATTSKVDNESIFVKADFEFGKKRGDIEE